MIRSSFIINPKKAPTSLGGFFVNKKFNEP